MRGKVVFILYNVLIVFILAFLMELILGYWLNNPSKVPAFLKDVYVAYYQFQDRKIIQVTECGKYDDGLFYTLSPGECIFENREFKVNNKINSLGIRDDEASLEFPSVIFLGDSFTMGWGVDQNKTFPAIIENQLNKKILNAGVSSYGTTRELELLKRINKDSLKYLFIQYHPTDYEENLLYFERGNKLVIRPEKEYIDLKDYINGRQKYFPGKHIAYTAKYFLLNIAGKLTDGSVRYDDGEEVKMFLNSLLNTELDLSKIQLIVYEIESFAKNDDLFIEHLNKTLKENKYPSYIQNMQTIKLAQKLNSKDYFILDDHINESGHKKVAEEILKVYNNLISQK